MITERQRQTLIEDTVEKIMTGRIVPVIGEDVFYIKDEDGHEMKVHDYVVRRLIERSGIKVDDWQSFYDKARNGFKGMSFLKKVFKNEYLNFGIEIRKLYKEENIVRRAYLSEEVYEFLTKRKYPLIITTSCSNILEDKLGPEYRSAYYMNEKKNEGEKSILQDLGMVNEGDVYQRLMEPTIYHILGNIDVSSVNDSACALTENDFLQYLHHLHDTNSRPKRLFEYIHDKRYVLALGCDIPDWTLRFLLYSIVSDTTKNDEISFNGGVIDTKKDNDLEEFLLNIDYYYEDVNQKQFISGINTRLSPEKKRDKIFVSVLSDDLKDPMYREYILGIVNRLKINNEVWFCEENLIGLAGEPYWKEIRKGLSDCDYFMPIITYRLLKQFKGEISIEPQPETERGIVTEWKYALDSWKNCHDFKDDFVKPVKIGPDLDDIKDVFFFYNETESIRLIRQLVFGKLENGQPNGKQIVDFREMDRIGL